MKKVRFSLCAAIAYLLSAQSSYALPVSSLDYTNWSPVVAIGAGAAHFNNIGKSADFPIQNPTVDQSYQYNPSNAFKMAPLIKGFVGIEHQVHNCLEPWQIGVSYYQTSSISSSGSLTQVADTPPDMTNYNYNVITRQLLAEGKWLLMLNQRYYPYLSAGIGASSNNAYKYQADFSNVYSRFYHDGNSVSLSYALGLGLDADINKHMRLGIGYRFADLGKVGLGNAGIDSMPLSGALSRSHVYSNQVLAQFTYII